MWGITIEISPDQPVNVLRGFNGITVETSKEQFIMLQLGIKGIQIELDYNGFATKTKHK